MLVVTVVKVVTELRLLLRGLRSVQRPVLPLVFLGSPLPRRHDTSLVLREKGAILKGGIKELFSSAELDPEGERLHETGNIYK